MRTHLGLPDETDPFLYQRLARLVGRMRLAGDDQLHGALRIAQQAQQALRVVQQQVRPFVGREATREPQGHRVGIEQMPRGLGRFVRVAGREQLTRQSLAGIINQRFSALRPQAPEA